MTNWNQPVGIPKMTRGEIKYNTQRVGKGKVLVAGADPVKLWPGHSHVAVVIGVVAGAAKSFLS